MAEGKRYEATVRRWGNTLAFRLPKRAVDELGLEAGDLVDIRIARAMGAPGAPADAEEKT